MASRGCFKCGDLTHRAENCAETGRLCYNCKSPGHESAACPHPRTNDGKQCYGCGGFGHLQSECPTLRLGVVGAIGGAGGLKCFSCGQLGHKQAACPTAVPGVTAAEVGQKCYNCGLPGHLARDCPTASVTLDGELAPPRGLPAGRGRGGFLPRGGGRGGIVVGAPRVVRCYK